MRKTGYIAIVLLIATACSASWASKKIDFTVPKTGKYYCWFTYANDQGVPAYTIPQTFKGTNISVETPAINNAVPKECTLYILDSKSGNEAICQINSKTSVFDVKPFDFRYVRLVKVKVGTIRSGAPIASATVELRDFDQKTQVQMLDPTSMGKALFYNVAAGPAWITVTYENGGKFVKPVDIPSLRPKAAHIETIPLTGNIDTVKASYDTDKSNDGSSKRPSFLFVLMILLAVGAVTYAIIKKIDNSREEVRDILKSHGIDLLEEDIEPKVETLK